MDLVLESRNAVYFLSYQYSLNFIASVSSITYKIEEASSPLYNWDIVSTRLHYNASLFNEIWNWVSQISTQYLINSLRHVMKTCKPCFHHLFCAQYMCVPAMCVTKFRGTEVMCLQLYSAVVVILASFQNVQFSSLTCLDLQGLLGLSCCLLVAHHEFADISCALDIFFRQQ